MTGGRQGRSMLRPYRCAPTVTWVKDACQTIVVEEERGQSWRLQGVEATIWDLLTLGYAASEIADFLALLLGSSAQEAQTTLLAVLRGWAEAGIVCAGDGPPGPTRGESGRG